MIKLKIDNEFASVAPRLTEREYKLLEEDLLERGCLDPLLVWNDTIVDGHNRYRICKKHNLPFAVKQMEFESRSQAKLWIVRHQLGRRNLTRFQRCELVLPFEADLKTEAERKRREHISKTMRTGVSDTPKAANTRDTLANMAGVSHETLNKAKIILEKGDEETKRRVRNGEISIHSAYNSLVLPMHEKPSRAETMRTAKMALSELMQEIRGGDITRRTVLEALDVIYTILDEG